MHCIQADELLQQLRAIALTDTTQMVQVIDGDVAVSDTAQLPKHLRWAVSSIEKSGGSVKVKFYDKLKALELLGKHLGLFDGGGKAATGESPLLEAILQAAREVPEDASEPQTAAGDDLVESPELSQP